MCCAAANLQTEMCCAKAHNESADRDVLCRSEPADSDALCRSEPAERDVHGTHSRTHTHTHFKMFTLLCFSNPRDALLCPKDLRIVALTLSESVDRNVLCRSEFVDRDGPKLRSRARHVLWPSVQATRWASRASPCTVAVSSSLPKATNLMYRLTEMYCAKANRQTAEANRQIEEELNFPIVTAAPQNQQKCKTDTNRRFDF